MVLRLATTLGMLVAISCLFAACGGSRQPSVVPEESFLVVVDYDVFHDIRESVDRYAEGLKLRGVEVHVEPWAPGGFDELRALVFRYVDEEQIEGALLVGTLPAAWYEQVAFKKHEEFPTDIVLQDRDAEWIDADEDGVFDSHTPLQLDLYVSRIHGSSEELREYFDRVDYYRNVGPLVNVSAFVFSDDPWATRFETQSQYLDRVYDEVVVMHDPADTTLDNYIAVLTGDGAEFVYQATHSKCSLLRIVEGNRHDILARTEVISHELRASFFNLFNCSAARFTETNLADAYVIGTGYGLATVGSTKMGAIWDSGLFHQRLSEGRTWGGAYLDWYNQVGVEDDEWHLGIALTGDPLLRLNPDALQAHRAELSAVVAPWSSPPEESELMEEIARTMVLGTYEEYREAHPEFFRD